jgi:hypothetical protein
MTDNNELVRGTDERMRLTIDGEPESEWNGLSSSKLWWVLSTKKSGGTIAIEKSTDDDDVTVVASGGGSTPAEITVDLSDTETESLTEPSYFQSVVIEDGSGRISASGLDPEVLYMVDLTADEVAP